MDCKLITFNKSLDQQSMILSLSLSVVNNAGVGLLGPVESISMEQMKRVFETNFFGTVRMIKEVMPDMKKRMAGHIIVMSSVMGMQGRTGSTRLTWSRTLETVAIVQHQGAVVDTLNLLSVEHNGL